MPPLQGTIQYWLGRLQGGHRRNSAPRWINLDGVCNDTTYLIQSVRRRSRGHSGFSKKQNIVACPPCALVELRDWVLGDAISNGTCLENVARSADHRGPANRTSSSYLPVSRFPPPLINDASHSRWWRGVTRTTLLPCHPGCLTNLAQSLAAVSGRHESGSSNHTTASLLFVSPNRSGSRPSGQIARYWQQNCGDLPLEMQAEFQRYCNAIRSGRSARFLSEFLKLKERSSQIRASGDRAEWLGLTSACLS